MFISMAIHIVGDNLCKKVFWTTDELHEKN